MKINRKHSLIVALAAVVIMCLVGAWSYIVYQTDISREKERSMLNAKVYAEELSNDFQRGITITETLEMMIENHEGKIASFESDAKALMEDYIGSIQLAPDGVVDSIYPLEGNEAGKLDLLHDPDRGPIARYGRDNDVVTLQGPFDLKQGGKGIAIRTPVFLESDGDKKEFWGFSIVIIKAPEIFETTFKSLASFGYDYTLDTTRSTLSSEMARVSGSISDDEELVQPQVETFTVGGSAWKLSVRPTSGWISKRLPLVFFSGISIGALVIVMLYLIFGLMEKEKRMAELAREAKQASEAKTAFLFNMSHDIRTPMNAIIGFTDLIGKHQDEPARVKDYLRRIRMANTMLMELLNNVLEMARI